MTDDKTSTSPMRDVRPATPPPSHFLSATLSTACPANSEMKQPHQQNQNHPVRDAFWKDETSTATDSPAKSTTSSSTLSSYQSINSQGELVPHRRYSPAPSPAGSGSDSMAPAPEIDAAVAPASPKRKRGQESPEPVSKKPKIETIAYETPAFMTHGEDTTALTGSKESLSTASGADTAVSASNHPLPTPIEADTTTPGAEQPLPTPTGEDTPSPKSSQHPPTSETPTTMARTKRAQLLTVPSTSPDPTSSDTPLKSRLKPRTKRTSAIPAITTRPSRVRKAPERLVEQKASPEKPSPAPKTAARGSKVFDPVYMTTNCNSRLAKVKTDLYHLLLEPSAWDTLSPHQQFTLTKMLPLTKEKRTALATSLRDESPPLPRPKELSACDLLRTDVAKFQSDLRNGYLAKGWQASAHQAMQDRKEGRFDEWKEREMEKWWGQKGEPP